MNSEDKLKERYGRENPFGVPENYFDSFAENMLEKLPSEGGNVVSDTTGRVPAMRLLFAKAKPYLYLAAMFCGLYFGINVMKHRNDIARKAKAEQTAKTVTYSSDDEYIDKVCEYAGIEKDDIYSYVSGQDYAY